MWRRRGGGYDRTGDPPRARRVYIAIDGVRGPCTYSPRRAIEIIEEAIGAKLVRAEIYEIVAAEPREMSDRARARAPAFEVNFRATLPRHGEGIDER